MKTLILAIICMAFIFEADIFARRGGGGGGRSFSSGRSSRSFSSNKSRSYSRPKQKSRITPQQRAKQQKQKALQQKNKAERKSKAKSYSKMDKKLAKKNSEAGKKYGNKKNAEKAYREKMASKMTNKFDKEPAKRPEYIPQSHSVGGVNYNVTYMNGGYGYMGPGGVWMMLTLQQMVITDAMLSRHGYGVYGPQGHPVSRPMSASSFLFGFLIVVACIGGVVFIVSIVNRNN